MPVREAWRPDMPDPRLDTDPASNRGSVLEFIRLATRTALVLLAAYLVFWALATVTEQRAKPAGFGTREQISFTPLTVSGEPSRRLGPQIAIYKAPYRYMSWLWDKDIVGGRVTITVPRDHAPEALGLMLSARADVMAVRLNGHEIVPDIRSPRLAGAFVSEPAFYRLPEEFRNGTSDLLELDIRRSLRDPIIFPDFAIAPIASLTPHFLWRNVMAVEMPLLSIVLTLFSILLYIMIAGPDAELKTNLAYIGTLLLMAISALAFLTFDQQKYSIYLFVALVSLMSFALGIFAVYFSYVETRHIDERFIKGLLAALLIVSCIVAISNYNGTREHFLLFNFYLTAQLFSTGALGIASAFLAWEIAKGNRARFVERFLLIICFGAIAVDRSGPGLFTVYSPFDHSIPLSLQWMPLVGSLVGFAMVFTLAKHADVARSEILSANARLDRRLKEREAQLREAYASREAILAQQVKNDERQRIMRDMHDGLGSNLMSMLLAARRGEAEPAKVADGLQSVIDEMRLLIDSMDSVGESLGSAFAVFRDRVKGRVEDAGLTFTWRDDSEDELPGLGPREVLQVFRIMQEAVTNALKHSRGNGLDVLVSPSPHEGHSLRIAIADNGQGMGLANPRGKGMQSMAARATSIGGKLEVQSAQGGVTVLLDLPEK